jgi:methylated-DNA-protein-cysteine methyltransferase-like protein
MVQISEIQAEKIGFIQAVFTLTKQIPKGKVLGYGHLAALIGQPRHARHVGRALKACTPEDGLPWWRVLRSDGSIAQQGDPFRGPIQKQKLIEEKVVFRGLSVDMSKARWQPEII